MKNSRRNRQRPINTKKQSVKQVETVVATYDANAAATAVLGKYLDAVNRVLQLADLAFTVFNDEFYSNVDKTSRERVDAILDECEAFENSFSELEDEKAERYYDGEIDMGNSPIEYFQIELLDVAQTFKVINAEVVIINEIGGLNEDNVKLFSSYFKFLEKDSEDRKQYMPVLKEDWVELYKTNPTASVRSYVLAMRDEGRRLAKEQADKEAAEAKKEDVIAEAEAEVAADTSTLVEELNIVVKEEVEKIQKESESKTSSSSSSSSSSWSGLEVAAGIIGLGLIGFGAYKIYDHFSDNDDVIIIDTDSLDMGDNIMEVDYNDL